MKIEDYKTSMDVDRYYDKYSLTINTSGIKNTDGSVSYTGKYKIIELDYFLSSIYVVDIVSAKSKHHVEESHNLLILTKSGDVGWFCVLGSLENFGTNWQLIS